MRDIKKNQIPRADLVFRGRMKETGFLNHPAFKYSFSSSGFKNYTFGAVTGPAISISSLFHEMGHAVDFILSGENVRERTLGGQFRFNVKQIALNGQLYDQVETAQCTERECRAFAIQLKLMHIVGFKTDLNQFAAYSARLTTWLPDWIHIDGNNENERTQWCKKYIIDLYHNLKDDDVLNAMRKWLDEIAIIKMVEAA